MRIRTLSGVIAGFITLWFIFYFFFALMVHFWPGLREVGAQVREHNDYSGLTTAMLLTFLLVWFFSYLGAGWVTVTITRVPFHALIAVSPFFLFAAWEHFYAMWPHFPPWYNLAVVLPVFPCAFLGGRLVSPERSEA